MLIFYNIFNETILLPGKFSPIEFNVKTIDTDEI